MRKNQKYNQEDMYQHISQWQDSGQSQQGYSNQIGISRNTFKYWLKKYRAEKGINKLSPQKPFIPIELSTPIDLGLSPIGPEAITITYPNGIQVECPASTNFHQLKLLIKL